MIKQTTLCAILALHVSCNTLAQEQAQKNNSSIIESQQTQTANVLDKPFRRTTTNLLFGTLALSGGSLLRQCIRQKSSIIIRVIPIAMLTSGLFSLSMVEKTTKKGTFESIIDPLYNNSIGLSQKWHNKATQNYDRLFTYIDQKIDTMPSACLQSLDELTNSITVQPIEHGDAQKNEYDAIKDGLEHVTR